MEPFFFACGDECVSRDARTHACMCDILGAFRCSERNDLGFKG